VYPFFYGLDDISTFLRLGHRDYPVRANAIVYQLTIKAHTSKVLIALLIGNR
jgi:hypothetical protein